MRLGTVELSTAQHSTPNTCHPRRSQHTAGGRRALRSAAARAPCTCRRPRRAAGPPAASQVPSLVSAAAQTSWSASACCVAPLQQSRDVLLSYGINPTSSSASQASSARAQGGSMPRLKEGMPQCGTAGAHAAARGARWPAALAARGVQPVAPGSPAAAPPPASSSGCPPRSRTAYEHHSVRHLS